jgi:hypothetical protein
MIFASTVPQPLATTKQEHCRKEEGAVDAEFKFQKQMKGGACHEVAFATPDDGGRSSKEEQTLAAITSTEETLAVQRNGRQPQMAMKSLPAGKHIKLSLPESLRQ